MNANTFDGNLYHKNKLEELVITIHLYFDNKDLHMKLIENARIKARDRNHP